MSFQDQSPIPLALGSIIAASDRTLARDLAEAETEATKGDWEKHWNLIDAANASHQQRLSRAKELADHLADNETGENGSSALSKMHRILAEEGIDSALAHLGLQSGHLIEKARANPETDRRDLQPLLSGAHLAITNGEPEKAEILFQQLLSPSLPDWPDARHEYIIYLLWTKGSWQEAHGSMSSALATYREAERQSRLLILGDPDSAEWQHDLWLCHLRLGDLAVNQGNLTSATEACTAAMEIAKALVLLEPEDMERQRDLSISHGRLGYIAVLHRNFSAAAGAYNAAREIQEKLVEFDPHNALWQHELLNGLQCLGDLAADQGDDRAASQAYTACIEIAGNLAAREPETMKWQHELAFRVYKLADAAEHRHAEIEARILYKQSHDLLEDIPDKEERFSELDFALLDLLKEKLGSK